MSVLVGTLPLSQGSNISFHLFFHNLPLPPGSASQTPDEASTAVVFGSVLGDVPCHHPLGLHGDTRGHEVWVEHPGQHHAQLAQLLVRPCLPGVGRGGLWDLRLSKTRKGGIPLGYRWPQVATANIWIIITGLLDNPGTCVISFNSHNSPMSLHDKYQFHLKDEEFDNWER